MIKLSKNLIVVLMLFLTGCANACVLSYEQLSKELQNRIYSETKQKLSGISSDFKIKISGIPAESYQTSGNNPFYIDITSQNSAFAPNSYKRVTIKDSKNNVIKAFPINVQTLVYKDVLVARTVIPYNKELKSEDVAIEKREISKYIGKTLSTYSGNLTASRNFQKGSIILSDYLKAKSVVSKNSIVEIIFLSDKGLRITIQGKALKDGSVGDTIPVRSDKYNKVYNAKISSSNEVTVRI